MRIRAFLGILDLNKVNIKGWGFILLGKLKKTMQIKPKIKDSGGNDYFSKPIFIKPFKGVLRQFLPSIVNSKRVSTALK